MLGKSTNATSLSRRMCLRWPPAPPAAHAPCSKASCLSVPTGFSLELPLKSRLAQFQRLAEDKGTSGLFVLLSVLKRMLSE